MTCCILGTRRHLKRYGVMSSTYQLLYMYCLCSAAEFVSWYSKKCGRKICFSVPILSASETSTINCSSEANYCKWIFPFFFHSLQSLRSLEILAGTCA